MSARAKALARLLEGAGAKLGGSPAPLPSLDRMSGQVARQVLDRYRALGGTQESPRLRPGRWDFALEGFVLELDEDLHFNRYRAATLDAPLYEALPAFPLAKYRAFSREREVECLSAGSYGGKWTNPSCERHFGAPGPLGDLEGAGAPRWRQRAVYDLMKDLAPLDSDVRMARISIWDVVPQLDDALVNDVLKRPGVDGAAGRAVLDLALVRASHG